jgi:bifunctional DNase/RNase
MNELSVVGVRVELPANQPIVLLKEATGERYLPIWIGAVEATAIAFAQQGIVPPRPLTHDLMRDVVAALGVELTAVNITELRDGVFFAELLFSNGVRVSARPSDAIALAVRTDVTIFASSSRTSRSPRWSGSASSWTTSRRTISRPAAATSADQRRPRPCSRG